MKLRRIGVVALAGVFTLAAAQAAHAAPILTFGQTGGGTPITATNGGGGSTTIVGDDVAVSVTGILAPAVVPFSAFFNLAATSTNAAVAGPGGQGAVQNYSGTFCVTSLINCGGTNYLSGSFTDVVLGAGSSLILGASQPPDTVTFTSSVIAASNLGLPRALALSFAGVTPQVGITNGSISSFVSSVSGTFSAEPVGVPEPATLALLGLGLFGAGLARRRRS